MTNSQVLEAESRRAYYARLENGLLLDKLWPGPTQPPRFRFNCDRTVEEVETLEICP